VVASLPAPDAVIERAPAALVRSFTLTERRLDAALAHWDTAAPPPRAVSLLALFEQRTIRLLSVDTKLAARVLGLDPALRDDVIALRELGRLTGSFAGRATVGLERAPPAKRLLRWYRESQRRFGVHWQLLAAINFVESAFGKVRNLSGAGAQGPMQFEPATWLAYGLGGDVNAPHDAILGAANYLAANDGARDELRAVRAYNPSPLYDDAVLRYARRLMRDPRAFLVYYSWQVYLRTGAESHRVTGPR
jgi:hypothetical protein